MRTTSPVMRGVQRVDVRMQCRRAVAGKHCQQVRRALVFDVSVHVHHQHAFAHQMPRPQNRPNDCRDKKNHEDDDDCPAFAPGHCSALLAFSCQGTASGVP
jgi:hypothetical protein